MHYTLGWRIYENEQYPREFTRGAHECNTMLLYESI